jgi:hypothetical protein
MKKDPEWKTMLGLFVILILTIWGAAHWVNSLPKTPEPTLKYKVGQIIYLKPDSLKVVVTGTLPNLQHYHVEYTDNLGKRQVEIIEPLSVY